MFSVAEEMNPLRRNTMEDVHVHCSPRTWGAPDDGATFLGVYDGHGGRLIADYLEDNLALNIAKEWKHCCSEEESSEEQKKKGGDDDDVNGNQQMKQLSKKRRLEDNGNNDKQRNNKENSSNIMGGSQSDGIGKENQIIQTALERAFLLTDIQSRMDGVLTSGATVVCTIVAPKFSATTGKLSCIMIHAANAGDARAVLSSTTARPAIQQQNLLVRSESNDRLAKSSSKLPNPELPNELPISKSKAVRITNDHKSTDPKEIARIEASGGIMIRGRVLGVLAVARSLGDHGLKEYVIAKPYLSSTMVRIDNSGGCGMSNGDTDIDCKDTIFDKKKASSSATSSPLTDGEFLIVACDGLWDVMEDQEACDFVRNHVREHGQESRENVSRSLIDEALKRGSTDNITVIVYWL